MQKIRFRRQNLVALFAFAITPITGSTDERPVDLDWKAFQGQWKIVSQVYDGKPTDGELPDILFTGDYMGSKSRVITYVGKFKLDPKKKPKTIDVTIKDKTYLGIYEIEGNSLWLCIDRSGSARPKDFASRSGGHLMSQTLKRTKE